VAWECGYTFVVTTLSYFTIPTIKHIRWAFGCSIILAQEGCCRTTWSSSNLSEPVSPVFVGYLFMSSGKEFLLNMERW